MTTTLAFPSAFLPSLVGSPEGRYGLWHTGVLAAFHAPLYPVFTEAASWTGASTLADLALNSPGVSGVFSDAAVACTIKLPDIITPQYPSYRGLGYVHLRTPLQDQGRPSNLVLSITEGRNELKELRVGAVLDGTAPTFANVQDQV